jgi:hypothetical protein
MFRGAWLSATATAVLSPSGSGDASKKLLPAVKVLLIICVSSLLEIEN